jgi:nucleotide-binding universal stress UspA family protein
MSIVCGTDFSEMAAHAATVAGCLAARGGHLLHLVHALDLPPAVMQAQPGHPLMLWAENQLEREANRLRAYGVDVRSRAVAGAADRVLQAAAHDASARVIVVGAVGHEGNASRRLGTRADRTAKRAHVPVLTVRDSAAFLTWFQEGRPLRVVLGVDDSESVEDAARWLDTICKIGPVDLSLVHLYWPPESHRRLGIEGYRDFVEPHEQIVKTLEQQFSRRLDGLLHAQVRAYCIGPRLGRVGDGLAGVAAARKADLLVVGNRALGALERLWEGSVARDALRAASMSVACVPASAMSGALNVARLRRVLVATDFSDLGNGAIPLGYAAVSHGGTVHLLHVVESGRASVDRYDVFVAAPDDALTSEAMAAATSRLEQLIPSDASAKAISTQVHVLASRDPSETICQAAERLGVDLICLGTHGRTGLAEAALGSVAAHVLSISRRPLLLARVPRP